MCVHASACADMCAQPYENQGSTSGVGPQELSISFLTQIFLTEPGLTESQGPFLVLCI